MIKGYSILNGAKYFSREDWPQNYLVFQSVLKYFRPITNNMGMVCKFIDLSDGSIKPPTTTSNK